ncbi:MAG TPA: M1 family metallopeptidase [Salinimicrobium sp.]|nr:M1 family metallopeptidase [Salinimicrobium sp.]
MKKFTTVFVALTLFVSFGSFAQENQESEEVRELGHSNENKFRQMYEEFSTPNQYRTASGAPGPAYYQNEADYKIKVELNDKDPKITGFETITYHNNSPDPLEYLWVQLDQNIRSKNSQALLKDGDGMDAVFTPGSFIESRVKERFDGGFNITEVSKDGKPLPYIINETMMRIDLAEPLAPGKDFSFSIGWWYKLNNHVTDRARSGYEHFEKDGNNAYVIAQFFPRMAVYNDVEGWQNYQFWGNGEFALPFGSYDVEITVPADHILDATGELQNRKDVWSKKMMERYEKAKKSYDKPVIIVTQAEAEEAENGFSTKKKTWKFKADKVRDFAFATSRKFIYDMMAVDVGEKDAMAISMYPKEGNPLWEEYSTRVVATTLKSYSNHLFEYPYPKAISVHAKNQGMEYPMICWNYGRPDEDGSYSDRTKHGMISVIVHEVGHNFFPMIVNSDERQWGWMDEGLNTFMQYIAEQEYQPGYPSRRGEPTKIIPYMKGNQKFISPIMSNPENVHQLGNNAYGKPATALNILRETVMGKELFDFAFKKYAERWMFKHPTPEDFFRTMEDASGVDLDWYWRGWFYTTDFVDIGVKDVKQYFITDTPTKEGKELLARYGVSDPSSLGALYVVTKDSEEYSDEMEGKSPTESVPTLNEYLMDNFTPEERAGMKVPKYFYEVTFNKPGGLVMPIIVEYTYEDGTTQNITYPVQVWRKNDNEVSKVVASDKKITKVVVDPELKTADIDVSNNSWPQTKEQSKFDKFKTENKG